MTNSSNQEDSQQKTSDSLVEFAGEIQSVLGQDTIGLSQFFNQKDKNKSELTEEFAQRRNKLIEGMKTKADDLADKASNMGGVLNEFFG